MSYLLIKFINFYQQYLSFDRGALSFMAPGGACRYYPSCSEYTRTMVVDHGFVKGLAMGLRRIISCR